MRGLILTSLFATAGCHHWTRGDTLAEAAVGATLAVDFYQTMRGVEVCREANPVIGPCGERLPPGLFFPLVGVAHAVIAGVLPHGSWRRGFQATTAGAEAATVWSNYLNMRDLK